MHLPKLPFRRSRDRTSGILSAAGTASDTGFPLLGGLPAAASTGATAPGGTPPIRTVLPRLRGRGSPGTTLAGYASTLVAAVTLVVAVLAPSPHGVTAEQAAASLPVAVPATPAGLPSGIEDLAAYVGQTSCDPAAKPGVLKLQGLLISTYPGTSAWSPRPCGLDGPGMRSEHYEGRALDWSVSIRNPVSARRASTLLNWLLASDAAGHPYANARRLGIMYIIWNNQMWRAYNPSWGWRPYRDCSAHPEPGYDTTCHRDHIHFSFSWAGAMGRTSFWTRTVTGPDYGPCRPADLNWAARYTRANPRPCPSYPTVRAATGVSTLGATLVGYSGATIGPGSTGPVASAVQKVLGLRADGVFGTATAAAVSSFRTSHRLPAGTLVDAVTWRALLAAFARPGGSGGTAPTTPTGTKGKPQPVTPAAPLARYSTTVLRYGARGPAVIAVQRALRVSPVSGWFGPVTRRAVISFQAAHGIPRTGNVGPLTWHALGG
jgi:peptidoglycan hydrolase-like protein with peptidoglycan-binding domain